ncbi:hypothetical protein H180DRAFT_03464 [Streptomyces sp. WMMB 322]|nr:hypothetical protein H180DRAFT_03464 [Streptomyces sp. WMMB 322]
MARPELPVGGAWFGEHRPVPRSVALTPQVDEGRQ